MDGTAAPDQASRRSLAEQLSPLAARLAASRSLTFPVLQIAADLPGPAMEAGPRAEAILRDWLARHGGAAHQPPETIASAEPWLRALQWQTPDEAFPGRLWRMETVLCLTGDPAQPTASLASRLSCTVSGEAHGVVPRVPGFIGEIADEIGLIADGRRLASLPQAVEAAEVDALVRLILAPARRLPVLVLAHTIDAALLVDAAALAARCLGLAHVALLGVDAGFALTRLLGKQWSVFDGGLRLYLPGCAPERQSRFDHPLVLGRDLRLPGEREARLDDLLRRAARASLRETAEQGAAPVPAFADLRAQRADSELHRRLRDAPDAGERLELLEQRLRALDAETRVLREEREQSIALALEYEQRALQAAQEVAEERREKFALRGRLAQLERRPVGAGFAEAPRPFGYDGLAEWVEQQCAGRLVLSAKAKRALADAVFADLPLVCDALALLADDYVTMRRAGRGREAFEAALQRLYLRDEMIAASPQRHRREPQYLCHYEGQELFTDRHLKKGNSYDPRESLRIYYAWEPISQQVVIGHLTSHLETEVS